RRAPLRPPRPCRAQLRAPLPAGRVRGRHRSQPCRRPALHQPEARAAGGAEAPSHRDRPKRRFDADRGQEGRLSPRPFANQLKRAALQGAAHFASARPDCGHLPAVHRPGGPKRLTPARGGPHRCRLQPSAPRRSGPPPLGTYACASYRTFVGVVISSIGTLHLVSPSAYVLDVGNAATGRSVPARGTYVVALTHGGKHPDQAKLTFAGQVLGGHWGYVDRKPDGSIYAIVFPDDEQEKPFDQGATFCYYQR